MFANMAGLQKIGVGDNFINTGMFVHTDLWEYALLYWSCCDVCSSAKLHVLVYETAAKVFIQYVIYMNGEWRFYHSKNVGRV